MLTKAIVVIIANMFICQIIVFHTLNSYNVICQLSQYNGVGPYYKASVVKTGWNWRKDGLINQQNRPGSPALVGWFPARVLRQFKGERIIFSTHSTQTIQYSCAKE